jgi:hypothetical protein
MSNKRARILFSARELSPHAKRFDSSLILLRLW